MSDIGLLAAQIRAARGLLNWSQGYLASGCRLARSTLADLESARRAPHEATIYIIMSELTAAGVEFDKLGVSLRSYPPPDYVPTGLRGSKEVTAR